MGNEDGRHHCVCVRISVRAIAQLLSSPIEEELLTLVVYEERDHRKLVSVILVLKICTSVRVQVEKTSF